MTREDAIKILEYIRYTGNGESEYKNCAQSIAIDMAIKALEQEPFMNKSCVSAEVCEHDKMQMLEKLRADINSLHNGCGLFNDGVDASLKLIDKYRNGEQK